MLVLGGGLAQAAPPAGGSDSSKAAPSKPPTPQELDAAAKAEKGRLANLAKAKAAAIPFLKMIVEKYPKSKRCEEVAYQIAILQHNLCEAGIDATGKPLPPEKLEQAWKEVAASLAKFCEMYPKSQFAGDALVKSITIALEQQFDLPAGKTLAASAVAWAKAVVPADKSADALNVQPKSAWQSAGSSITDEQLKLTVYDVYLRAGFVAYLEQNYESAKTNFEAASKAIGDPSADLGSGSKGIFAIALKILILAIQQEKPVTDAAALQEKMTDKQRVAIQMADLYLKAMHAEKAETLYRRIISKDDVVGRPQLGLRGYATMKLAESLDRQRYRYKEALEVLAVFRGKEFEGTYWGGYGLFRLAVTTYNQNQDKEKSLEMYGEMIRRYPDHPTVELAYAYYCLNAFRGGHPTEAAKMFEAFKTKYPASKWLAVIQEEMVKTSGTGTKP